MCFLKNNDVNTFKLPFISSYFLYIHTQDALSYLIWSQTLYLS